MSARTPFCAPRPIAEAVAEIGLARAARLYRACAAFLIERITSGELDPIQVQEAAEGARQLLADIDAVTNPIEFTRLLNKPFKR